LLHYGLGSPPEIEVMCMRLLWCQPELE
jgi:hypothetical protein